MTVSELTLSVGVKSRTRIAARSFAVTRGIIDATLFKLYDSKTLRRSLRHQDKLNLGELGIKAQHEFADGLQKYIGNSWMDPIAVHARLVQGLPGQALFIAASLAFDSLTEALPFFDVTSKTAWLKLEKPLSTAESEQALRLGRVATMASDVLGSAESGRQYLRTANFALGGATPLELLKTAEGEQLVLNELQTQFASGPV